jgi:uncharacterized protein (DUF1800 family)
MAAVMRALIESPEFWASDQTLFKTPLDFACSALAVKASHAAPQRTVATASRHQALAQAARIMGMADGGSVVDEARDARDAIVHRDIGSVLGYLSAAGQPLHGWQTPDGYGTAAATWMAPEALTRRADLAFGLVGGMSVPVDLWAFFSPITRERIIRESPQQQMGLMLASPDFMRK